MESEGIRRSCPSGIIHSPLRVEANLSELASCREKIVQLEETVRISSREIDDSHALNERNLIKLTQLSEKLEQVNFLHIPLSLV